ncbi:MAG: hypothetical protein Kow0020_09290 [Wenzhouxiangellaceae bacterium]
MSTRFSQTRRAALRQGLEQGLEALGQRLGGGQREQLIDYLELLSAWNRSYNLTAVIEPEAMIDRHLVDSLSIRDHLTGHRIMDVGSGAGLPGVVLAVAEPDRQFTLVDSNGKKVRFLRHVGRALGLANVDVLKERIEALSFDPLPDEIVCRALAPLPRLVDWLAPALQRGSRLLAMKAIVEQAERGAVPDQYNVRLEPLRWPGQQAARCLAIVTRRDTL